MKTRPANRMSEEKRKLHTAIKESKAHWKSLTPAQREAIKATRREKRKQAQINYLDQLKHTPLAVEHKKYTTMVLETKTEPVLKEIETVLEPFINPYPMLTITNGKTALHLDHKTVIILKAGADPEKVKEKFLSRNNFHEFLPNNFK